MSFRIKELREKRGMTQEKLSENAGVSRATISKLENKEEVVTSTETICKIAGALGCSVSEIFL